VILLYLKILENYYYYTFILIFDTQNLNLPTSTSYSFLTKIEVCIGDKQYAFDTLILRITTYFLSVFIFSDLNLIDE
jgi:hypothetical protein